MKCCWGESPTGSVHVKLSFSSPHLTDPPKKGVACHDLPSRSSFTSLAAFSPSSRRFLSIIFDLSAAALSSALTVQPMAPRKLPARCPTALLKGKKNKKPTSKTNQRYVEPLRWEAGKCAARAQLFDRFRLLNGNGEEGAHDGWTQYKYDTNLKSYTREMANRRPATLHQPNDIRNPHTSRQ